MRPTSTASSTPPAWRFRGWSSAEFGRVITLVSDAGRVGEPNFVVYSGAKAGAAGFDRVLAKAVGQVRDHRQLVSRSRLSRRPPPRQSSRTRRSARHAAELCRQTLRTTHDAARLVLFLASRCRILDHRADLPRQRWLLVIALTTPVHQQKQGAHHGDIRTRARRLARRMDLQIARNPTSGSRACCVRTVLCPAALNTVTT